jgi:hypothetical protein
MTTVTPAPDTAPVRALRRYHLLALLPAVGLLGGVPLLNRVEPYVLGLPFLLFWIVAWVVATSGIMALIWWLDHQNSAPARTKA